MQLKKLVPWWAKIGAKMVLSRTQARYHFWRRLNLFVHGQMDSPEYALRVVRSHVARTGWSDLAGKVVLELGPGDSLFSAVIAKTLGARRVILIDAGPFATADVESYLRGVRFLREQGLRPPDLGACSSLADILAVCNAEYLTRGLEDLRQIPAGSVDFAFSQAVLEHVKLDEIPDTFAALRRVMSAAGVTSHDVDLKDHLGEALNNLRFARRVWESDLMASSGFYTNRVRFTDMINLYRAAGFTVEVTRTVRWDALPTARRALHPDFRHLPDEELRVSAFDIVARPA